MENFDLLAVRDALKQAAVQALIRRIIPAEPPDNAGILLQLEKRGRRWIILSPGPLFPCALPLGAGWRPATADHRRRPTHPSAFIMLLRKYLQGATILTLRKPPLERVISISARNRIAGGMTVQCTLLIELTGRSAALVLLDEQGTVLGSGGRHSARFIPGLAYAPPPPPPGGERIDPFRTGAGGRDRSRISELLIRIRATAATAATKEAAAEIRGSIHGFGPRHAAELASRLAEAGRDEPNRSGGEPEQLLRVWDRLLEQLQAFRGSGPHPAYLYRCRKSDRQPILSALSLGASCPAGQWREERLPALAEALADRRQETIRGRRMETRRRDLQRTLRQARKKNERLDSRLEQELAAAARAEQYQRWGELLTAALDSFGGGRRKRGLDSVRVPDFYAAGEEREEIPLDPKLTLVQNAQSFFRRYRRALRGREAVSGRLTTVKLQGQYLEELLSAAELAEDEQDLIGVADDLEASGLARPRGRGGPAGRTARRAAAPAGFRRYRGPDGLEILVGRSARGNDQLTFRHAGAEDFWLHAAGMPGSHVVVRNPQRLAELPPDTLALAAGLAAYFSRGRMSSKVEVLVTRRKHLRRPGGAPPGLVTVRNCRTVMARPADPGEI